MTDPNPGSQMAGPDDKTTVLPETAVALVEMERLQQELQASEERAKNHWEQYLRALADVDNVRKRAAKDLENTRQFAVEKFAQDLVAVKDSLELGIATLQKEGGQSRRGQPRRGAERHASAAGQGVRKGADRRDQSGRAAFNPELHEAMMAQPSDAPPNTVLSVVQKGYQLNGRLLRPARVIVSAAEKLIQEQFFLERMDLASTKGPRVNTQ